MTFPVFASGDVLNASDMNAVGLWLVKTQTIGTAVSSVTVTGAFSADYDNYKVLISGGAGSTGGAISLQLGSTTTGYYRSINSVLWNGTHSVSAQSNAASFGVAAWMETNHIVMNFDIINPFATKNTIVIGGVPQANAGGAGLFYMGYLADSTSYTAFTISSGANTMTGGTIRVYGYRN